MFDKILDWILQFMEMFYFFVILDEDYEGVILRMGKFNRIVKAGFHWKIPFYIEQVRYEPVTRRTSMCRVMSVTSSDKKAINLSPVIVWSVGNIKRYTLEIHRDEGEDDTTVIEIVYGVVDQLVSETLHDEIHTNKFREECLKRARTEGNLWGIRIRSVGFADRAAGRAIRLFND